MVPSLHIFFTKVDLLGKSSHTQLSTTHSSCFTQPTPSTNQPKGYPWLSFPCSTLPLLQGFVKRGVLAPFGSPYEAENNASWVPERLRALVGEADVFFWGGVPVRLPLNLEPFKMVFTRSLEQEPRGFKVF